MQPFFIYTQQLQFESCTLSDFYGYWATINFKLKQTIDDGSGLSTLLLDEMNQYTTMLLKNPIILAAAYLDPRYQMSLSTENKKLAISFLAGLNKRIIDLKRKAELAQETQTTIIIDNDPNSTNDFRDFLQSMRGVEPTASVRRDTTQENEILRLLKNFDGTEIPLSSSILQYWNSQKDMQPQLFKLSSIIFSVPPTQTSVERAFSSLAIILGPRRVKLSDQTLQNILLVRLNHNLNKEIVANRK